ncbi:hypothetical protein ACH4TE_25155 [Streptomyces sioyaensis]
MGDDEKSTRRAALWPEMAKRLTVALSVRALWAVIVELFHGDT